MIARRAFVAASAAYLVAPAFAQALRIDAPNPVPVSPRLFTSGQPTRAALAQLGGMGFQAVVYLAPNTVPDAIRDEPEILRQQGIEFVHIPVPFGAPTPEHFAAVTATLRRLADRQVLVHCQVNMRASTMVFLHRAITLREDPARAYESVTRVWSPEGPWRSLVTSLLAANGIDFQPL